MLNPALAAAIVRRPVLLAACTDDQLLDLADGENALAAALAAQEIDARTAPADPRSLLARLTDAAR